MTVDRVGKPPDQAGNVSRTVRCEPSGGMDGLLRVAPARLTGQEPQEPSADPRFEATVDALAWFRHEHGRWPKQGAPDPAERAYAWKLSRLRQAAKGYGGSSLTVARRAYADRVLGSDWRGRSYDFECFSRRVDAIAEHKRRTGRWPSMSSNDPDEVRLGNQLVALRQSAKGRGTNLWDEQRQTYVETTLGAGWEGRSHDFTAFMARVDEIADFISRTGHMPGKSGDDEEYRLAQRLHRMRHGDRGLGTSRVDAERRAYIEQRLGRDWANGRNSAEGFQERVDEIADFIARTGRMPRESHDDEERRLAERLVTLRRAARGKGGGRLPVERRAYLEERLGRDWENGPHSFEGFQKRVDEVADFIARTGRRPRYSGDDEERRLAGRLKSLRRAARGLGKWRLDAERLAYLHERLGPDLLERGPCGASRSAEGRSPSLGSGAQGTPGKELDNDG